MYICMCMFDTNFDDDEYDTASATCGEEALHVYAYPGVCVYACVYACAVCMSMSKHMQLCRVHTHQNIM